MKRKGIAQETLKIQQQGYYEYSGNTIDFEDRQKASEKGSFLLTPEQGHQLVRELTPPKEGAPAAYKVVNQSTVQAIVELAREGHAPAVLNFASAKNPGGGFLGGAMAQEEALAASSGLYSTLLLHKGYYTANRGCGTMMYTDHAIYSPEVVFFRDGKFGLLEAPVTASVLTLPAVNMGQVLLKGEDAQQAKQVMKDRMRLCLAILPRKKTPTSFWAPTGAACSATTRKKWPGGGGNCWRWRATAAFSGRLPLPYWIAPVGTSNHLKNYLQEHNHGTEQKRY